MERNGDGRIDRDLLQLEIENELIKHFKSVDNDILSYLTGTWVFLRVLTNILYFNYFKDVIDSNQEDFTNVEEIQDAVGPILSELATDGQSDDIINDLCANFLKLFHGYFLGVFFHKKTPISQLCYSIAGIGVSGQSWITL